MSNKKFILQFDFEGNIGPIKSSVEALQKSLKGVKLPDNIGTGLDKTFSRLSTEFENFEAIVKTGFDDLGNISKAEKSFGKISTLVNQLSIQAGSINGIDPKKLIPQESLDRLKGLEKAWADVKKESERKTGLDKEIEKQTNEIKEQEKALKKLTDQYEELDAKNRVLRSQKGNLTKEKNSKEKRRTEVAAQMTALEGQKGGKSSTEYKTLSAEYSQLSQAIRGLESDIRSVDKEMNSNKVEMAGLTTQIDSSNDAYKKMQDQLINLKNIQITPKGLIELRTEIAKLTGMNINEIPTDLEELQKVITGLTDQQLEEISKSLVDIKANSEALPGSLTPAKEGIRGLGEAGKEVVRTANEIENLKSQVLQFFSITNSIQLFKRAITSALNTVKELDATMTEAAVVTDFSVGDMWEKLPEYSKNAQALGVSINGMYQATTLYFQQGLKTNEAMELGVETMKMAKIAGMDSAKATEAMTAALRGFNMALNETSATRVNDVYSQLAAVTAADTEQIATAMEKTASIAASANMEFETTAALLAQIIETTQEAPETAGTAMKTIIARFAEVKSLRDQGLVSGEDEDGEAIDVNKIQTALRSVGISMEGFFSGTEGLDSVLLKLAEKWGSLDFETQRYIATMAAGSRQQSRFIAMMSDYKRTTELVGQAQNSTGASQKQFQKTQESLETSLTRLKNAWDEFLMGLANNEALKFGIDMLTKVLETINGITDAISGGNGLTKSLTSLFGVIGTLKIGRSLLDSSGVSSLFGQFTGQSGSWVETRSTSKDEKGNIVEAVVRNPVKQGEQTGMKAGNGFVGGFVKAIKANKAGEKGASNFIKNTFGGQSVLDPKKIKQVFGSLETVDGTPLAQLQKDLENNKITAQEAVQEYERLGGNIEAFGDQVKTVTPNLRAIGGAALGAGAAVGLLGEYFEQIGNSEAAETCRTISTALMGIGTALMVIQPIANTVANSLIAKGIAVQAAWWWIFAIVAVLGVLAVGITHALKAAHENSLEAQMEAAAEATERAKEAAESASQAYDELLSAKEGYNDLQNQLDALTKGTLEWKKALAESNAQVLELLDKYPELAQYINRGEHGELEISERGWEKIQTAQEQSLQNSQNSVLVSQLEETRLQQKKILDDLNKQLSDLSANAIVPFDQEYDEFVELYKKDFDNLYKNQKSSIEETFGKDTNVDQVMEFAFSAGLSAKDIEGALVDYQKAMANSNLILQQQAEALISNSISNEFFENPYAKEVIAGIASGYAINRTEKEKQVQNALYTDNSTEVRDLQYFKDLADSEGILADKFTGDDAHDLEVLYAKMAGITRDEIADGLKGNSGKLVEEIAKMQAAKDAGIETERIFNNLSKLDHETQQKYATLMSKDVSNATFDFANMQEIDYEQMAKDLGFGDDLVAMAKSFGYDTVDAMEKGFSEVITNAQNEFEQITRQAQKNNIGIDKEHLKNASTKQLQNYVDLMTQALTTDGKEGLEKGFDKIFEEATTEQDQKILQLMSTFNWTEEGAGEEFVQNLKDMGISIDENNPIIAEFVKQMGLVNAVYRDFDLTQILDKAQAGLKEAEEIAGQRELTTEQYEKFVASGAIQDESEWSWNGRGWVNVTNGMSNLVTELKNNTIATLKLTKEEADKQIEFFNTSNEKFDAKFSNEAIQAAALASGKYSHMTAAGLGYQKNQLLNGTASEAIWSILFNSESDYKKWLELRTNGIEEATRTSNILDGFTLDSFDLSSTDKVDPYEKYYNEYEVLTTLMRQREQLEKKRNKLLQEGNAKQARENKKQYITSLKDELNKQDTLIGAKKDQIDTLLTDNIAKQAGLSVSKDGTISFNVATVNSWDATDYRRKEFDDLLSQIESLRDQMREAEDSKIDIEIELDEYNKEDRQEYIDAINKAKEALLKQRQDEIDELKNINDSINDTNSKILNSMQEQLADSRQARDNAKTEEELADKQRRLAYLQQDTSGANAMEIMKLQKEIEEGQESYTDKLIDQKISELQKQNDLAAEQRERQIEVLEAQRALLEQGAIWPEVYKMFEETFTSDGNLNMDSSLIKILKETSDFSSMSKEEQESFLEEIKVILGTAYGYPTKQYATGGLASFTGPAWLDGTKSRPEYVLNADQTQAFFSLVDVLTGLGFGNSGTSQNIGDSIYDIDINVESIGSDYDVEQMAEKVKGLIVDTSRYRNNNTL